MFFVIVTWSLNQFCRMEKTPRIANLKENRESAKRLPNVP